MIVKFLKEFHGLLWTLAGTALVLITLSGTVKVMALWISGVTMVMHFLGVFFQKDE